MATFHITDGLTQKTLSQTQIYKKIINLLMQKGKRSKAVKILYKTFLALKKNNDIREPNNKTQKFARTFITEKDNLKKQSQLKYLGFRPLDKKLYLERLKDSRENENYSSLSYSNFLIFHKAIENVSPYLEVRKVRSKGTTRQIPTMIKLSRQQTLAIRWLIDGAFQRKKKGNKFSDSLAIEIIDAFQKQGIARQKRNDLHKMAHSNRANLRYRWW